MPTINLPQDNRWGALGQGLGNVISGALEVHADKQLGQQVSQVMQDDTIAPAKKPTKVLEQFGRKGLDIYDDLLKGQQQSAVITHLLAQTAATDLQNKITGAKAGVAQPMAEAELQSVVAGNALKGAQTAGVQQGTTEANALMPGKLEAQSAAINQTQTVTTNAQAQTPGIKAASTLEGVKVEQAQQQLDRTKQMLKEGGSGSLDNILTSVGIDPNSADGKVAKNAYMMAPDITKASEGFMKVIQDRTKRDDKANTPVSLQGDERKFAGESSQLAESLGRYVDVLTKNPQETGLLASAKGFMVKHGLMEGDPALVDLMENQLQIVASHATAGGGFFSPGRVTLSQSVTPSVNRSVVANIIAADTIVDREIAKTQSQIDALAPNVINKPLKDNLAKLQKIKETTGSFQAYEAGPEGSKKPVTFFKGDQVDPQTFKPLLKGSETFKFKGENWVKGADVLQAAKKWSMTPQDYLAALKSKYGG